jgi:hypothetical protein
MFSLSVMYVYSWCVARRHLEVLLPTLDGWVVIVSLLEPLIVGRFSWFMYLCHVSWMICVGVVMCLGSFLCTWNGGSISVSARVDRAMPSLGLWGGTGVCLRCVVMRVPMLR